MADLDPTTALGSREARCVVRGLLSLTENENLALASLALLRGAERPAPFGLELPSSGRWVSRDQFSAFWSGPDQWIVEGHGRAELDFCEEVAALCAGCSVTEQTDGLVAFEIRSTTGEAPILALMARLVNLDPARFVPGSASRTGLEHMSVFVIRRANDHLAILGMRSAAASLWRALDIAISRLSGT